VAFDIDDYTATSAAVHWADLDLGRFAEHPLEERSLRTLRYMTDVEYHTVCYTRDLLTTPSHRDPDVNAFMTMWNREEFWHGEALAAVLAMHGVTVQYDELRAKRLKLGWKDRLDPIKQSVLGSLVGGDFIATHMAWGAANEWSAITAYNRMAELERDPVLAELLRRIAKQEARHVAFYTSQARSRLAASTKAQKLTRFALKRFWAPVGSTIMERSDVVHVMTHLMSGPAGRDAARRVDRSIAGLPGLSGLHIVEDALDGLGIAA
jgi:hypothetical protein